MEDQSSEVSKAVQEETPSTSSATLIRKISTRKPRVRIGQCRICERYMEYRPLVIHLREVHGVVGLEHMVLDRDRKRCMYCPVCDMILFSQEELVEHCRNDHDDKLCVVETKTFSSIDECQNWKKSVERTHCTAWRINWRLKASGHETVDYRCSRVFSMKKKPNKKCTQHPSRFKVACCTSFLKVVSFKRYGKKEMARSAWRIWNSRKYQQHYQSNHFKMQGTIMNENTDTTVRWSTSASTSKEFILYDGTVVVNYCLRHVSHDVPVLIVHMPEDSIDRKASSVAPQLLAYALKDQISKKYVGAVRDAECPLCHSKMSNNEDLANHCYKDHEKKDCRVQTIVLRSEAAFKKYTANDGSVLAKFCTKHIGHEIDVASLPLSKGDKNVIFHHLQQGHTTWDTVIKIRQEFTNPSTRLFWISEQDVARVQQSADPQISTAAHRFNSVPAAQLLEESSMFVDDGDNYSTSSDPENVKDVLPMDSMDSGDAAPDDVTGPKALEVPVSAESLIGCSMCVQLKERVLELEATVEVLRRKLMEREDSQLFHGQMKKEQS